LNREDTRDRRAEAVLYDRQLIERVRGSVECDQRKERGGGGDAGIQEGEILAGAAGVLPAGVAAELGDRVAHAVGTVAERIGERLTLADDGPLGARARG